LVIDSIRSRATDPLRLRRRLGVQGLAFALLLLVTFTGAVVWGTVLERLEALRTEARQLAGAAAAQLPLLVHEHAEVGNARKFRDDQEVMLCSPSQLQRVRWWDARGQLLSQVGTLPLPLPPPAMRAERAGGRWSRQGGVISVWLPVYTRPRHQPEARSRLQGFVQVGVSEQQMWHDLARLQRGLLLGSIAATLAALVLGRRMLAAAFLPLQRQVEALERFTAEASHELRHPLTALRTLVAATPPPAEADLQQALGRIDQLAARLGRLLDDLLFLARQEQGVAEGPAWRGRWQRFDLLELLEDQLALHAPLAAAQPGQVRLQLEGERHEVPVRGQPEQLQRLFTNLLLNALRFSPPGGLVVLTVSRTGAGVQVQIRDQGPGIPAHQRELVFERFWRDPSQPDQDGHSGLGLAIARAIARGHGGDLRAAAGQEGGGLLVVTLPLA